MDQKDFSKVLDNVMQDTMDTLASKGDEYASVDRLSNFKAAGLLEECIPEKALFGMVAKHIIALRAFIERIDQAEKTPQALSTIPDKDQWKEKTHDIIAYMILLWALIEERTVDAPTTDTVTLDIHSTEGYKGLMIYLASPYSNLSARVREARYIAVCIAAAKLIEKGIHVFSPIAHSHGISLHMQEKHDWTFWRKQDIPFLQQADGMLVLCLDGWEDSVGIKAERKFMLDRMCPVFYTTPDDVVETAAQLDKQIRWNRIING